MKCSCSKGIYYLSVRSPFSPLSLSHFRGLALSILIAHLQERVHHALFPAFNSSTPISLAPPVVFFSIDGSSTVPDVASSLFFTETFTSLVSSRLRHTVTFTALTDRLDVNATGAGRLATSFIACTTKV